MAPADTDNDNVDGAITTLALAIMRIEERLDALERPTAPTLQGHTQPTAEDGD